MNRLREVREWRRVSQAEAVRASGIIYPTVSRLETVTVKPTRAAKEIDLESTWREPESAVPGFREAMGIVSCRLNGDAG